MTGLSLYRDGLATDPPLTLCAGCARAEAEIRALLDRVANSFMNNPAKFLGFELPTLAAMNCSELFHRWVKKFDSETESDPKLPMCPGLKKRIEALVYKLLNERYGFKRKRETVLDALALFKSVAINPFHRTVAENREGWVDVILRARKALSRREEGITNAEDVPCLKRQKTCTFLRATNFSLGSHNLVSEPVRRSKRTLLKICSSELTRKHIPIGDFFQADVPGLDRSTK